jgi:hypothetical protein
MEIISKIRDSDVIRHYQWGRQKAVEAVVHNAFVGKIAENYFVFNILMLTIVFTILGAYLRNKRKLTIFFFHIACMSFGSFLLLANGIVAFRDTFLVDSLSPIMQHSKKLKVRVIHRTINIAGSVFIFLGYLFILSDKFEEGESLLPQSIHGCLGYLVIILIIVQSVSGLDKLEVFRQYNTKVKRWHTELGLFTWDTICFTVILGCLLLFGFSFLFLFLTGLITFGWLSLHLQIKKKMPEFEELDVVAAGIYGSSKAVSGESSDLLPGSHDGSFINEDDDDNNDYVEELNS